MLLELLPLLPIVAREVMPQETAELMSRIVYVARAVPELCA